MGHAIDFGGEGFSDQRDMQEFAHDCQFQMPSFRLRGGWVMDL
jgi:hypothetical protein